MPDLHYLELEILQLFRVKVRNFRWSVRAVHYMRDLPGPKQLSKSLSGKEWS